MAKFDDLQDELEMQCDGVNRYNPQNLEMLEDYVDAQIKEDRYDLEANLTVLKLYQLNPARYKADVVSKILLKCLMSLPSSDIVLAKSLIDRANMDEDPVKLTLELADLLEVCQFKTVWELLKKHKDLVEEVDGFEHAMRRFICHVVDITYQNVPFETLKELLGDVTDDQVKEYCKDRNWQVNSDGYVFISNHEATVKSRNIEEKIDFSSIQDIIRAAS